MPDRIQDTHNIVTITAFSIALIASVTLTAWLFSSFFTDFLLACLLVGILSPWHTQLTDKLNGRKNLSAIIISGLLCVVIAIPATYIITSLSVEVHSAYVTNRDSVTMAQLQEILFGDSFIARQATHAARLVGFDYTPDAVNALLSNVIGTITSFLGEQINDLLTNLVGFLFHMTMLILMVFYLFIDSIRLKNFVFRLSPLPDAEEQLIVDKFKSVGQAILMGNGLASIIQGALGGCAMAVAGVPSPVLWASVMTVAAFLPLVGISIISIPCAIYLALNGKFVAAIVFFVLCSFISIFVESIVKTKLIGARTKMHNFVIFLSILGGLGMFGILGLLYGPLVVTFFLTMSELYEQHYRPHIMRRFKRLTVS